MTFSGIFEKTFGRPRCAAADFFDVGERLYSQPNQNEIEQSGYYR